MVKNKSKGLGDSIEKITEWTGLKKLTTYLFGDDCGCEERKNKLNAMFPKFKNIRVFTVDEKKVFESVITVIDKDKIVSPANKTILTKLYLDIFNMNPQWSSCGSCNLKTVDMLKRVYANSCEIEKKK